jgi:diaminopimelate epimerase
MLAFHKMHGLGNDFVVLDLRGGGALPGPDLCRFLADRRRGVGCDQIVAILASLSPRSDCFMSIFNADGSEAGACGNATRCVADLLMRERGRQGCVIETKAGLLSCSRDAKGLICVDMGPPRLEWDDIPLSHACDPSTLPLDVDAAAVSMGNPHCVVFVDDLEDISVGRLGPSLENNDLFPDRVNVEFLQIVRPDRLHLKVWERGTGQTPACGSGACAALVAAVRRGKAHHRAEVILDGGSLTIEWVDASGSVLMTGPACYVFEGTLHHGPF